MGDLVFRIGEKRAIKQTLYLDLSGPVTSVACTIYDSAGNAVVTAGAGTGTQVHDSPNGEFELSYIWDTAGRTAGDYTYQISYSAGGETVIAAGEVSLYPLSSKFDRWARRVAAWLLEEQVALDRQLSLRRVADAVQAARKKYELARPREVATAVALTASVFEYSLPSDWVIGQSGIQALEYPVDDTEQVRQWLPNREFSLDEPRGKWRFVNYRPSAGQSARLYYTTGHVVRDAAGAVTAQDTIPDLDFEAVSQYAAGFALLSLANRAPRTNQPNVGAEIVNYRTKEQEYGARARAMMEAAEAAWGGRLVAQRVEAAWDYLPDHGRTIYPVTQVTRSVG